MVYGQLFLIVLCGRPQKIIFIPALLDFLETLLILIYLKSDVFYPAMNLLPWISASKWFLVSPLTFFILVQLLKKQLKGQFVAQLSGNFFPITSILM